MDPISEKLSERRKALAAALTAAIVEDTEESLRDPANKFTEASKNDTCCCYGNMNAMLRMTAKRPEDGKYFYNLIQEHNNGRTCGHIWHYKKTIAELREYNKPREF